MSHSLLFFCKIKAQFPTSYSPRLSVDVCSWSGHCFPGMPLAKPLHLWSLEWELILAFGKQRHVPLLVLALFPLYVRKSSWFGSTFSLTLPSWHSFLTWAPFCNSCQTDLILQILLLFPRKGNIESLSLLLLLFFSSTQSGQVAKKCGVLCGLWVASG